MITKYHLISFAEQSIIYGQIIESGVIVPVDIGTTALPLYQGNTYVDGSGYTPISGVSEYLQRIEFIYLNNACSYWTGLTISSGMNGNCVQSLIPGLGFHDQGSG